MKNYQQIDKQYLWHPFTQMQDWLKNEQLVIAEGKGSYLYDTKRNKYLDGVSSLWVTVHGHRKKELNQAIKKQLDKLAHSTLLGLANVPSIELAKELVKITPKDLNKVFYSDNGSTAVEIALKIAFQYWQQIRSPSPSGRGARGEGFKKKTKFLTLINAYHGDTVGSVSVGGIDLFHKIYRPLLFSSFKVGFDLKEVEKVMKKHHHKIAAMIVEPLIQGAAGMLTQPKGFLKGVRKLCTKYNILLICDEVATGFGRTGKMFACEHEKVSPDILCLAKGITGGYLPLAATLTTNKIYQAFLGKHEDKKTFFHGHTYTGNPLGCAAALANLEIFRKEKTIQKLQAKIKFLTQQLKQFNNLTIVGDIRQCGFMVGIELFKNKTTKEPFPYKDRVGHQVILEARKRGVVLRPLGDVIVLMPPLSISHKELEKLLRITYESIAAVSI
ncbi:adenosylmethionine--8-amino-7-oxononanoate transaminase [candidate division WOR-1 bacterium RIFOXYB2_FULL_42_35]|uniref:Adenosylmethionine-8-amino-7-oxononanoate aminotransferase n=1 Tax=candidate division WOR-1 bacterium RIFOXYC2_FULL_41_25 TaxID=1802586 RepID=A0A1F4TJ73_UNCSA|nr:MAG: adenosylmethionine--8-amino-7-oxononanoate transaminase [candidate division WOR-1 bacterium RIFOXYA2_FULL_41_14]OGC21870.1 MAG: adenosylmethionine--8-amino-7-oxononanoate transaminase [candidate division WOR-1 bacterium RIFOXYB2_FULL_42_35]OGC32734.1 MAG: adenosylmethionine--8-amino-7-oxononanoate transaminase [candidate division WOR-1 bacterium RIFOXYC2_FULL_41_25]